MVWIESITATAGCVGLHGGQNFLELGFGQHLHLAVLQTQAARAQSDLGTTFLARDIQRGKACTLQGIERLQQQRGFPNARVAADEHHAPLDDAATQHPIELLDPAGRTRHFRSLDGR
jgi:hypothetical protein